VVWNSDELAKGEGAYETDKVGGIDHKNECDSSFPKRRKKKGGEEVEGENGKWVVGRRRSEG
jgi:hypothetical protein